MKEALEYAIEIIESYQMEIRALQLPPGATQTGGDQQRIVIIPLNNQIRTLAEVGFCQGKIYTTAIQRIRDLIAKAEYTKTIEQEEEDYLNGEEN